MNPVHESQLPAVLTIEHMAQLHGIPVRTLYKALKLRTWPYTELPRMGRGKRWSRDAVLQILRANGGAVRRRVA